MKNPARCAHPQQFDLTRAVMHHPSIRSSKLTVAGTDESQPSSPALLRASSIPSLPASPLSHKNEQLCRSQTSPRLHRALCSIAIKVAAAVDNHHITFTEAALESIDSNLKALFHRRCRQDLQLCKCPRPTEPPYCVRPINA